MRVLYVHQNFPAQFGHVASHLANRLKWDCRFVSETPPGVVGGVHKIKYALAGGATAHNHFCSRTFENTVWHCDGVYRALKALPDYRPDLIVGHSGFGSTLFLRELYPGRAVHQPVRVLLPRPTAPTRTWTSATTSAGRWTTRSTCGAGAGTR